jgi:hypothetical protein
LDTGYDSVYLMLAGGRLFDLIQNGQKDAARLRRDLAAAGLSGARLRRLTESIEPTRLAHRLDPDRTWLFSGVFDTVVPPENSEALARAIGLGDDHHRRLLANHYSGIIYLPMVFEQIRQNVTSLPPAKASR